MVTPKKTYILISRTAKSKRVWFDMISIQVSKIKGSNIIGKDMKPATFKEPKRGILQRFKKELSSEDYDDVCFKKQKTKNKKQKKEREFKNELA